jgi:hypothetical protein
MIYIIEFRTNVMKVQIVNDLWKYIIVDISVS